MSITRTRVVLRAKYGWPRKSVKFNPTGIHQPDGYRTNAAGYVSMCYAIPRDSRASQGGLTTVTLLTDGWFNEIDLVDLKPGDLVGYLGPDSIDADGGVAVIFEKWINDNPDLRTALTWEHLPVVGTGPDQRARPIDFRWHAYRFRDIED